MVLFLTQVNVSRIMSATKAPERIGRPLTVNDQWEFGLRLGWNKLEDTGDMTMQRVSSKLSVIPTVRYHRLAFSCITFNILMV